MNAAFLLVTTVWLAGADPVPEKAPPPAPAPATAAPAAPAPAPCAGCGACGSCCESEGFLAKLRARFHKDTCDTCAPAPCCAPAPKYAPAPCFTPAPKCASACDTCDGPSLLDRIKARLHKDDCGCAPTCGCQATCGSACDAPGLLDRLRARFHKDDCDCGCGCGAAAVAPAAKPAEPLKMPKEGEPKKLPEGGDKKIGASTAPNALDLTPAPANPAPATTLRPF